MPAQQHAPQDEIVDAGDEGAPCQPVFERAHQKRLGESGRNGHAEDHRAFRPAFHARRPEQGKGHGGQRVHQGKENQEGLGAEQVVAAVAMGPPHHANDKREQEAADVKRAPALHPVHADDERVEQGVVAEQQNMIAAAGGRKHWRHEGAGNAQHCQRHSVLDGGQNDAAHAKRHEKKERQTHIDHLVTGQHEKDDQIKNGEAAALQGEAEHPVFGSCDTVPAEGDHGDGRHGAYQQPHLNREQAVLGGQLEARGDAEEQQNDADLGQDVAADEAGPERVARWCCRRAGDGGRGRRWRDRFGNGRRRQAFRNFKRGIAGCRRSRGYVVVWGCVRFG